MSTKSATIYNFFAGFGIDAYEENSVYSLENPPAFPYITYENKTDSFGAGDTSISFSLWFRSTSWVTAHALADEISEYIGQGGKQIPCDGGFIWIKRGQPYAQDMGDNCVTQ